MISELRSYWRKNTELDNLRLRFHVLKEANHLFQAETRKSYSSGFVQSQSSFDKMVALRLNAGVKYISIETECLKILHAILFSTLSSTLRRLNECSREYKTIIKKIPSQIASAHHFPKLKDIGQFFTDMIIRREFLEAEVLGLTKNNVSDLWDNHFYTLKAMIQGCCALIDKIAQAMEYVGRQKDTRLVLAYALLGLIFAVLGSIFGAPAWELIKASWPPASQQSSKSLPGQ